MARTRLRATFSLFMAATLALPVALACNEGAGTSGLPASGNAADGTPGRPQGEGVPGEATSPDSGASTQSLMQESAVWDNWVPLRETFVDGPNPACTDSGPGTEEIPFCTVQAGVGDATPGTSVGVKAGTYGESVQVKVSGTVQDPISIHAYQDDWVVIDSPGFAGFDLQGIEYVKIAGFEIRNAWITPSSPAAHGGAIRAYPLAGGAIPGATHCMIAHNILHDSDAGVWMAVSPDNWIKDNIVYGVKEASIRLKRSPMNRLYNNLVYRNGVSHGGEQGERWGITFYCSPGTKVIHNTVYEETGGAVYIYEGTSNLGGAGPEDEGYCVPSRASIVRDNILVVEGDGAPLVIGPSTTPTATPSVGNEYTWNLLRHGSEPDVVVSLGELFAPRSLLLSLAEFQAYWPGYGANSLDDDPQFVDPANNDFQLAPGSPALGAASDGTDLGVDFGPLLGG